MQRKRWSTIAVLVVSGTCAILAGCSTPAPEPTTFVPTATTKPAEQPRPTSDRMEVADDWASFIFDFGRVPVVPPTEDMYVGDVFLFDDPPIFSGADSLRGLRTSGTPRWTSLDVLSLLEAEYRQRPSWVNTAVAREQLAGDPGLEAGEPSSIYSGDQVPARHRLIGIRAISNVTFDVHDLEPFVPMEVAPLIQGPATRDHISVSLQAGEAESYSLSVDALLSKFVDRTDGPDGTSFRLKPEHLGNVALMADPETGKAYAAVISEVIYIRSVDVTVRMRRPPPSPVVEAPGAAAPAAGVPAAGEPGSAETSAGGAAPQGASPLAAAPAPAPADENQLHEAIRRAQAMNETLRESGIDARIGGTIQFVMAMDHAVTVRRTWPYPLAIAVRGITVEVDAATGHVSQVAPLGLALHDRDVSSLFENVSTSEPSGE